MNKNEKKKKKLPMPNVIAILMFMMFIAMIATWIVPSGSYDQIEGPDDRMIVVPGSYQSTESTPVGIFDVFKAIPEGLTDAGMIAWTILIIGGTWQVLSTTGTITLGVNKLVNKLGKKEVIIIPIVMIILQLLLHL